MKLYQVAKCPFAHRARIVLEEKKLPYEVIYFESHHRPPELEALSPDAKSPSLFDDDEVKVWDSFVVMEYLEDRYPDVALLPKDAAGRAATRLLMRELDNQVVRAQGPVVQELVFKSSAERDAAKLQQGIAAFEAALVPWDARLEGRQFLYGEQFTLADATLFPPLLSMRRLLGERGEVPKALAHVRAWYDRVAARPSTAY